MKAKQISGANLEDKISVSSYLPTVLLFHMSCRKQIAFSYMSTWLISEMLKLQIAPSKGNFCFQGHAQCSLKVLGNSSCKSKDRGSLLSLGYAVLHQQSFFYPNPSVTFVPNYLYKCN